MFNAMAGWCFDYYYLCLQKGTVSGYARNVNRYEVLNVVNRGSYGVVYRVSGYARIVNRYEVLNVINRGSYGVVYRAMDKTTGEIVAMKHEIKGLSPSTLREISILKSLPQHPSIVEFKEVVEDDTGRVFVVMEYLNNDLQRLMHFKKRPFTVTEVRLVMKQILEGVSLLHNKGVMHRDLKPSNILINSEEAQIKICDFGLSRDLMSSDMGLRRESTSVLEGYTSGVGTLWYKAPEILRGEKTYTVAIDMWSVGCIMAELVLDQVLIKGHSRAHQLDCINKLVGAPSRLVRMMLAVAGSFSGAPRIGASGFDLVERLLALDPEKRITAEEALNHDWFKQGNTDYW